MGQVTTFESAAVPAHIANAFRPDVNDDLTGGVAIGYPIVSYKGKSWAVTKGGERNMVMAEFNGDTIPAPSIDAVIVRSNPALSKIYYPSGYEEGSDEKPTCYSNDSIAPALDAQERQATKCAICPHNQWGSRITDNGAKGKACSDARRLAIVPSDDMDEAMLLRVPAASLKELLSYAEQLKKRGVAYQTLVTRISFDGEAAYPKLQFKPQRWLTAEEIVRVQELYDSDVVSAITALNSPSVVTEEAAPADDFLPPGGPAQTPAAPPKAKVSKAKAQPAEVEAALAGEQPSAGPKTTGFGGKKTQAAPAQASAPEEGPASTATVLAEGALSELDAVLSQFDDAAAT